MKNENISHTPNGPTSASQNQYMGDGGTVATMLASISKGGMRGIALLAMSIAEIILKNKALDLAEDYYKVNKKDYDFFLSTHQGPMAQTAGEAFSPTLNPSYVYDFFSSLPAGMGKSSIVDKQWFETRRRAHRYSVGVQRRIDYDFSIVRTHAIVAGWNLGRRYEINWADDRNNRRFDRQINAANMGIGVGNIVREGLSSAVKGLASSYDNLGDTIATIGNGLAASGGYAAGTKYAKDKFPTAQDNKAGTSTAATNAANAAAAVKATPEE